MEPKPNQTPLIVVVGETASGKSALALKLAEKFNGEIIAADSRTVYRCMDIGTAKPTHEEQRKVRHHLLDVAALDRPITAAEFKCLADQAIKDVRARGKLPLLVGGTGLYIDAILYDFSFAPKANLRQRTQLERLSVEELQQYLKDKNIPLPLNAQNKRHLIRQAETGGVPAQPRVLPPNVYIVGLRREADDMKHRITERVDVMLRSGLEEEVRTLAQTYGWDARAMQTIGYQEFRDYFKGGITAEDLKARIIRNTLQYAKRQRTWFRRNKDIHWISNVEEGIDLVTTLLNK